MSFYARPPRLAGQLVGDGLLLVWVLGWFLLGRIVDGAIRDIAAPVRDIAGSVGGVRDDLADAGGAAGSVPGIGGVLRGPLDAAAGNLDGVATAAAQQAATIETAATLLGIATFVIPAASAVFVWLPRRLAFHRENAAARRLLAAGPATELLALRALATQPVSRLVGVTADPLAAWRSGDPAATDALAQLELRRLGLG